METVDPITGATPEWEAFIATLDPDELEHERFGRPTSSERPGSYSWRLMVAEHEVHRNAFYSHPPRIRDYELATMLAEARQWDRRFTSALTPEHVRIALRAADNTEKRSAA